MFGLCPKISERKLETRRDRERGEREERERGERERREREERLGERGERGERERSVEQCTTQEMLFVVFVLFSSGTPFY